LDSGRVLDSLRETRALLEGHFELSSGLHSDVLDSLRETRALLEGHFELSSGLHSDRYFQCARVLQYPERAAELALALAARVRERTPCDVVVGPALTS